MNCKTASELLLEAEPATLAGHGDAELAAHLRECARCRALAARLLDGQALLEARLAAFRPRLSADEALARVGDRDIGPTPPGSSRAGGHWRRRLRPVAAALPLAAATALAVLTVGRERPAAPLPIPQPRVAAVPAVRIPAGRDAAIFRTANPKITVVWIY